MLNKLINFFKSMPVKPYEGSSAEFIDVSNRINEEFNKPKPNLPRIMSLLSMLVALATTEGDSNIIYKHQARFKMILAEL